MWCVCVCVCKHVRTHVLVQTRSRSNLGNSLYHMENKAAQNISMTMQKIQKWHTIPVSVWSRCSVASSQAITTSWPLATEPQTGWPSTASHWGTSPELQPSENTRTFVSGPNELPHAPFSTSMRLLLSNPFPPLMRTTSPLPFWSFSAGNLRPGPESPSPTPGNSAYNKYGSRTKNMTKSYFQFEIQIKKKWIMNLTKWQAKPPHSKIQWDQIRHKSDTLKCKRNRMKK
jgi:hypothetical protein